MQELFPQIQCNKVSNSQMRDSHEVADEQCSPRSFFNLHEIYVRASLNDTLIRDDRYRLLFCDKDAKLQ